MHKRAPSVLRICLFRKINYNTVLQSKHAALSTLYHLPTKSYPCAAASVTIITDDDTAASARFIAAGSWKWQNEQISVELYYMLLIFSSNSFSKSVAQNLTCNTHWMQEMRLLCWPSIFLIGELFEVSRALVIPEAAAERYSVVAAIYLVNKMSKKK